MKELERKEDIINDPGYYLMQLNSLPEAWKFNYLPLLIKSANLGNIEKADYLYEPMVKLLVDVKSLMYILMDKGVTYKDIISYIRLKIRTHPINLSDECKLYSDAMLNIYQVMIPYIYGLMHDNKTTESALFGYSPIVPYGQILKKVKENPLIISGATERESLLNSLFINNVWDIYRLTDQYTFDLSSLKLGYSDDGSGKTSVLNIDKNIAKLLDTEIESEDALQYYVNAYVNYFTGTEGAVEVLTNYINALVSSPKESMEQLISNLEVIEDPEYIEWLLSLENTNNLEYLNDKNERRILDKIEIKEKEDPKYDLNILLSYIYTNRRYMTNQYTNSLFTSTYKSINGYTFINQNDMVVCEIDENYLAVPVIDLADDYKMKLICMGSDEEIIIRNFKDDMK